MINTNQYENSKITSFRPVIYVETYNSGLDITKEIKLKQMIYFYSEENKYSDKSNNFEIKMSKNRIISKNENKENDIFYLLSGELDSKIIEYYGDISIILKSIQTMKNDLYSMIQNNLEFSNLNKIENNIIELDNKYDIIYANNEIEILNYFNKIIS